MAKTAELSAAHRGRPAVKFGHRPALTRRRRVILTLLDQAVSSGISLGAAIAVASQVDDRIFGAFSLAVLLHAIALGVSTGLAADPLTTSSAHLGAQEIGSRARSALSVPLWLGLAIAAPAGTWLLIFSPAGAELVVVVVAVGAPGLLVHEFARQALFAQEQPGRALLVDFVWFATQVFLFVVFWVNDFPEELVVAAWPLGALASAAVGLWLLGPSSRPMRGFQWLRSHGRHGLHYTADFLVMTGATHAGLYVTVAVSGLAELGALRAALLVMGPASIVIAGMRLHLLPEWSRFRESNPRLLQAGVRRSACAFVVFAAGWAGSMIVIFQVLGERLLGQTWASTDPLLVPAAVLIMGRAAAASPFFALRAIRNNKVLLRARAADAVLTVAGGGGGAAVGGALGCIIGMAAANVVAAIIWWLFFRKALAVFLRAAPVLVEAG